MPSRAAAEGTSAPSASPTRSARDARARLAAAATRVASDGARDGDGAGDGARDGEDRRVTRGERPSSAAVGGVAAAKDAPLRAMRRRRFGGRYLGVADARFAASGAGSRAARGCRPAAAARGDDAIGSALATTTDIAWARYPLACRGAGRCDEERRRREQRRGDGYRFLQTPFRERISRWGARLPRRRRGRDGRRHREGDHLRLRSIRGGCRGPARAGAELPPRPAGARPSPDVVEPPTRVLALLGHFFVVFAACDRWDPRRAPPSTGAAPFGDPFRPPLPRRAHPRPSSD